jgi:ABC-type cobalt transport system substrate-binding protein
MWSKLNSLTEQFASYFVEERRQERSTTFFLKAIMIFTLLRLLHLWSLASVIFYEETIQIPDSVLIKAIFLPAFVAPYNINLFLGLSVLFILIAIFLKPNYIVNGLFFWLVLNLLKLKFPLSNGSDYVLVLFALYAIPLAGTKWKHPAAVGSFNTARLLIQWQIVLIYLISGLDKLRSETWRTGQAFQYISQIEFMFNPFFSGLFESPTVQIASSWLTIIFELSFVIFVYMKRTRLAILCVGLMFHLIIWLMLSLPDFASVMIIGYLIFLTDADYKRVGLFKQSLP